MIPQKKRQRDSWHGWIVLDKPYGISSNQALQKVRSIFGYPKAGHGGTLDPLATGLLPIALGEATKLIPYIMDKKKTYEFVVTWGEQRDTDDAEGIVIKTSEIRPTSVQIESILSGFIGDVQQTPPVYSALKFEGKRLCDWARQNRSVSPTPRIIHIDSLKLIRIISLHQAQFQVICGKGTYVRSLARDLAESLGTVGYVSALRRLAVGPFQEKEMLSFEKLLELKDKHGLKESVSPVDTVLDDIPVAILEEMELDRLKKGQKVPFDRVALSQSSGTLMVCKDLKNNFHALAWWKENVLIPERVFNFKDKE